MHDRANIIANNKFDNFRKVRLNARNNVVKIDNSEEITLHQRYESIGKEYSLNKSQIRKLIDLEYEFELKFCRPRSTGIKILNHAIKSKKKVILISDIFFNESFILKLLEKNNIKGFDKIYLSSEVGLLKHTGNLFKFVLNDLNANPRNIIHLGDNFHSDITMANKNGIEGIHLERTTFNLKNKSNLLKIIKSSSNSYNTISRGIVGNKFGELDYTFTPKTLFSGSAYNLGFGVLGHFFLGFAKWLIEKGSKENVDAYYFLSRDGDIIKKCYDIIAKHYPKAPKSHYMLASRRSVNVASVENINDIIDLFDINYSPATLEDLFRNRIGFDVTAYPKNITEAGFVNSKQTVRFSSKDDKRKIASLVMSLEDLILEHTHNERTSLIDFYRNEGLLSKSKNMAIVDIGHNGTMQKSLANLLNCKIDGYYFCTYNEIDKNITHNIGNAFAYLAERLNPRGSNHAYCRNILMFEMAFLNEDGSFVKIKDNQAIKLSVDNEKERVTFAKSLHTGIVDYCTHFFNNYHMMIEHDVLNPLDMISPYVDFLDNPTHDDAKAFLNITFENKYSCRERLVLLTNKSSESTDVLWKKGQSVIESYELTLRKRERLTKVVNFMNPIMKIASSTKIINQKKYSKYNLDPNKFFYDSKSKLFRRILSSYIHK